MNILVTINRNYLAPLRTMLVSLFASNTGERFTIYLLQSGLTEDETNGLYSLAQANDSTLRVIDVPAQVFSEAPLTEQYPREMYFRLLAQDILPDDIDRVLYLDPDILVLDNIRELYDTPFDGCCYAAASHCDSFFNLVNRIRFRPYRIEKYYNSGVLLIDLERLRGINAEERIFNFISGSGMKLYLPDQDVLNAVFAGRIKDLDAVSYNFDPRCINSHSFGRALEQLGEVTRKTVIMHFCGRDKPWNDGYKGLFHALYIHYADLAQSCKNGQLVETGTPAVPVRLTDDRPADAAAV